MENTKMEEEKKVEMIINAINEYVPEDCVRDLLTKGAKFAFKDSKDCRHEFYSEFITMIEEKVVQYVNDKKEAVEESKDKLNKLLEARMENEHRRRLLNKDIKKKEDELTRTMAEAARLKGEFRRLKALAKATKHCDAVKDLEPLKQYRGDIKEAEEKLKILDELTTDLMDENKSQAQNTRTSHQGSERKNLIRILTAFIGKIGASTSLILSCPIALMRKMPSEFDKNIIKETQELIHQHASKRRLDLANGTRKHLGILEKFRGSRDVAKQAYDKYVLARQQRDDLEGDIKSKKKELKKILMLMNPIYKLQATRHDASLKKSSAALEELMTVHEALISLRDRQSTPQEEEA